MRWLLSLIDVWFFWVLARYLLQEGRTFFKLLRAAVIFVAVGLVVLRYSVVEYLVAIWVVWGGVEYLILSRRRSEPGPTQVAVRMFYLLAVTVIAVAMAALTIFPRNCVVCATIVGLLAAGPRTPYSHRPPGDMPPAYFDSSGVQIFVQLIMIVGTLAGISMVVWAFLTLHWWVAILTILGAALLIPPMLNWRGLFLEPWYQLVAIALTIYAWVSR